MRRIIILSLLLTTGVTSSFACSRSPSWTNEAAFNEADRVIVASILSYDEQVGRDGYKIVEGRYREIESIRGVSEPTGIVVEMIALPERPAVAKDGAVVYEIACSNVPVVDADRLGQTFLLFLEPDHNGRWRIIPTSEQIPDIESPFGQEVLAHIHQFATK